MTKIGTTLDAFDAIHAPMLRDFAGLVGDLGGDPKALMARAGVAPVRSAAGRTNPTYRQFVTLLEQSAAALGCSDFGLRLAARQTGPTVVGPLGECTTASDDLSWLRE